MTNLNPCPFCGTEASFQLAVEDDDLTSENEEESIAVIGEEGD